MVFKNSDQHRNAFLSFLIFSGFLLLAGMLLSSFKNVKENAIPVGQVVKKQFLRDIAILKEKAEALSESLHLLQKKQTSVAETRQTFAETKKAFKRVEYLIEYLDPELAKKLNGAPIPKVVVSDADYLAMGRKEPLFITLPPEGLQVLEEMIFSDEAPDAVEAGILAYKLGDAILQFSTNLQHQAITDKQILESLREEVIRVITMGITGFDAPGGGNEMENAAIALQPVLDITELYVQNGGKAREAGENAKINLKKSIDYLRQNPDFDTFDRLHFIRELADPAYGHLTALQQVLLGDFDSESALIKPVNNQATSLFAKDFLQTAFYAKQDRKEPASAQVELGKMLFFDPVLSSNNKRSCASCHNPEKAFTDGKAKSVAFNETGTVSRNSPTLLNSIFSTAYFWDSRAGFLEDQISEVVKKQDELHSSYAEIVGKLEKSSAYQKLFKQAFKNQVNSALNTSTVNRAIAAYIRSLVALNSPFDKYMRRETSEMSASAIRGANLFMGKAACATCHFAPVFNGTVPPRFLESEVEVIGVPLTADLEKPIEDPDKGRGQVIKAETFNGAFKTPTVRNAALTAPYMHNGVFNSLEEVIAFYNRGGGSGLGLNIPNQTLPFDNLSLTEIEKKDLVAFLETLTDNADRNNVPGKLPTFPVNANLNNRPVGGKY